MIATDRPSVTDSSVVVPEWELQAENGLLETGNQGRNVLDLPETPIRIGVGPTTELRFTAADYYQSFAGPGLGFGDFALGIKRQLLTFSAEVGWMLTSPTYRLSRWRQRFS